MTELLGEAIIRKPLMSGHCASGGTDYTNASHERCQRNGGYQRANPQKEFQPCPCPCHYGVGPDVLAPELEVEVYECGGCGREIIEAVFWPLDADGDPRYTHIDGTGKALGEDCTQSPAKVSGNPEAEFEADYSDVEVADGQVYVTQAEPEVDEDEDDDNFIGLDLMGKDDPTPDETEDMWDDLLADLDLDGDED